MRRSVKTIRALYRARRPRRAVKALPAAVLRWNDGTVPKIIAAIRKEGRWADVPILADALEEAGYTDRRVLDKLRNGDATPLNDLLEEDEDLAHAASQAAGNWRRFGSFAWRQADDPDADHYYVAYTSNRDSGLMEQSNAAAIEAAMAPYTEGDDPDAIPQRHSHWAVGHVDGYAIRVYRHGQVTPAFRAWRELQRRLEDYPLLDEQDYARREYEMTVQNIAEEGAYVARRDGWVLPADWEQAVFSWFWENDQHAVENRDDQGGYPSDEEVTEAFTALGYERRS